MTWNTLAVLSRAPLTRVKPCCSPSPALRNRLEMDTPASDLKRAAISMGPADGAEEYVQSKTAGLSKMPLTDLPDEVLSRVLAYAALGPHHKVCRRWEHIKVLLARERCVQVLIKSASLDETLSREVEHELFVVSSSKVGPDYKSALRRIIFNVRPGSKNPEVRGRLLSRVLTARAVVRLTPDDMATQEEKAHKEATTRETVKNISVLPGDVGRVHSSIYKCPRFVLLFERN